MSAGALMPGQLSSHLSVLLLQTQQALCKVALCWLTAMKTSTLRLVLSLAFAVGGNRLACAHDALVAGRAVSLHCIELSITVLAAPPLLPPLLWLANAATEAATEAATQAAAEGAAAGPCPAAAALTWCA